MAADKEYKHCGIAPASQILFNDTDYKTLGECETACAGTGGCTAWYFRPHSFDKEMPGLCKQIDTVFKIEESTKAFCGEMWSDRHLRAEAPARPPSGPAFSIPGGWS